MDLLGLGATRKIDWLFIHNFYLDYSIILNEKIPIIAARQVIAVAVWKKIVIIDQMIDGSTVMYATRTPLVQRTENDYSTVN